MMKPGWPGTVLRPMWHKHGRGDGLFHWLFSKYLLRTYYVLGASFGSVPELREQGLEGAGANKGTGEPGAFGVGAK